MIEELHKLESYDIKTIQSFIDNEIEESIHIDYKAAEALSKKDSKKKEISKDISAFANSDGGIIIYGVNEINHKPTSFSFIDGEEFTKEWLEQIISTTINRKISDLKIFPIRKDGDLKNTIYVVQIPSSVDAPHLSRDNRFYRRYNFESAPMEEYEIRQLYGRKLHSKILVDNIIFRKLEDTEDDYEFEISVDIFNEGEVVEEVYKINAYIIDFDKLLRVHWRSDGPTRNNSYTRMLDKKMKVSSSNFSPIYPNELITGLRFNILIPKETFEQETEKLRLEAKIYFSNGEDEMAAEIGAKLRSLV